MKVQNCTLAIVMIALFCSGNALAQNNTPAAPTAFAYDSYYAQDEDDVPSPSDAPVSSGCGAASDCGCASGSDSCCNSCRASCSSA